MLKRLDTNSQFISVRIRDREPVSVRAYYTTKNTRSLSMMQLHLTISLWFEHTKYMFNRPEYMKKWYQANKDRRKLEAQQTKNYMKDRMNKQEWLLDLKSTMKCNRCPENDPRCLDFHHTDHTSKSFCVSAAPNCGYSRERILEEIAKCEVICSNCHRKETFDAVTYKAKVKRPTRDKVSKFDIRRTGKLKEPKIKP